MPIIPQRKQQNRLQTPQGGTLDSGKARLSGESISRAAQGIARGVGKAVDYYQAKKDSDDAVVKVDSTTESEKAAIAADDQARRTAEGTNGDNMSSDFDSAYSKAYSSYTKGLDDDQKKIATQVFEARRVDYQKKLLEDARKKDLEFKKNKTEEFLSTSTASVYQDPSKLDSSIEQTTQAGVEMLQLSGPAADNYKKLSAKTMTYGAIQGLTDKGRYKEAEALAAKRSDLFGVTKGQDGFKSTPELIDEIRAQKSRQLDYDAKIDRASDRENKKAYEENVDRTYADLSNRVTKVVGSSNTQAQQELLDQIDVLESNRYISKADARYQKGRINAAENDSINDDKESFELTSKILGGGSKSAIDEEIKSKATSGEIKYSTAEKLLKQNRARSKRVDAKSDTRQRALADKYINDAIPTKKFGITQQGAGQLRVEIMERTEELRAQGLNYVDAARRAIRENTDDIKATPLVQGVSPALQSSEEGLAKAAKMVRRRFSQDKNKKQYIEDLRLLKQRLDTIKRDEFVKDVK